jgi:hypothetical protein
MMAVEAMPTPAAVKPWARVIDTQHDGLAIDHKLPDAVLQGGLGDPGIAFHPIIAAPGDQTDTVAVALDANAKAVLLDFVEPLWAGLPFFTEGGGYKVDPRRDLVRRGLALEAKPGAVSALAPTRLWLRVGAGKY